MQTALERAQTLQHYRGIGAVNNMRQMCAALKLPFKCPTSNNEFFELHQLDIKTDLVIQKLLPFFYRALDGSLVLLGIPTRGDLYTARSYYNAMFFQIIGKRKSDRKLVLQKSNVQCVLDLILIELESLAVD